MQLSTIRIGLPRLCAIALALAIAYPGVNAGETQNVILVTMDGLRWQELFSGADSRLMTKDAGDVP